MSTLIQAPDWLTGSSPPFPPFLPLQSYQIIVYKSALHQAPDWSATSAPREASVVLHGGWGSSGALMLSTGTCVAAGLGMRPFTSEEQPDVFQVWMWRVGDDAVRQGSVKTWMNESLTVASMASLTLSR